MNEILINIISVLVTAVVLPLISFAGTKLISWLNAKVKDENAKMQLTVATNIVKNAVLTVFQTYVDSLGIWNIQRTGSKYGVTKGKRNRIVANDYRSKRIYY